MAEINNLVVAEKSDLVAIANAIRAKTGNTNSMSFPYDFVNGIEGIASGGSSGSDGSGSGGSGNSGTYASVLYKHFDVDIVEYPYVMLQVNSIGSNIYVYFFKTLSAPVGKYSCTSANCLYAEKSASAYYVEDFSIEGVVMKTTASLSSTDLKAPVLAFYTMLDIYDYTNFETTTSAKEKYRLDYVETKPDGDLPTDTLEGLTNGYDVMFYDENNEGLAFYSIKQGHSIEAPVYNCKNWQDTEGRVITFPYTPNADLILYASSETYADMLYSYFGLDKGEYPYIFCDYTTNDVSYIYFCKTISWFSAGSNILSLNNFKYQKCPTFSNTSDIDTIVRELTKVTPNLQSLNYNTAYCNIGVVAFGTQNVIDMILENYPDTNCISLE